MIALNLLPHAQRTRRDGTAWRVLAVVIPVATVAILASITMLQGFELEALAFEEARLRDETTALQPVLAELSVLRQRESELRALRLLANEIREGEVIWTTTFPSMLALLPAVGGEGVPLDFKSVDMRAVVPPSSDPTRFAGANMVAEANITGTARNPSSLAAFVRNLERAEGFGVAFQNAIRQGDASTYSFSLTVAALAGDRP